MCCSAWPAAFSKTITGTWEVLIDDVVNHVIWYQNRIGATENVRHEPAEKTFQLLVQDLIKGGEPDAFQINQMRNQNIDPRYVNEEVEWRKRGGQPRRLSVVMPDAARGNCLIVPLMGSWESIRLLNTFDTPDLLSDIDNALEMPLDRSAVSLDAGWGALAAGGAGRIAFLQFDVYDIVIAENASRIGEVIGEINPEKRPEVNPTVFNVLESWYQCPVAVCCFNPTKQAEAKPIGFAFEPSDPDYLVVYTLDGHDGQPPRANMEVFVDHTLFVGSFLTPPEYTALVNYRDPIPPHLAPYVLNRVMGVPVQQYMINGDVVFDVAAVRKGYFDGVRSLPRHAPTQYTQQQRVFRTANYSNGRASLSAGNV